MNSVYKLTPLFAIAVVLVGPAFATGPSLAIETAERDETVSRTIYQPTWESLDSRPLPTWYDDVKFGLFLTWGVYSVPSVLSEWFQYCLQATTSWCHADAIAFMRRNYKPNFTYQDFAAQFSTEFYNPNDWASLIKRSGAKYIVLTTKHGDGFSIWPSKYDWNWNSVDVGPKRDLVGELAESLRSTAPEVHLGLYYCLGEWFNPLYVSDAQTGFKTQLLPRTKVWPQLKELVETYKPDILWSDEVDLGPSDKYWNATDFVAWLYNERAEVQYFSPVKDSVLTNDRWGNNVFCKHGGFWTCQDRFNPGVLMKHKWENCMTIDVDSWGFRRTMTLSDVLSIQGLILTLMTTVSCGGNLLMNVGPTGDGRIVPIFQERLTQMGEWLSVNGEAVYGTKPWIFQNDTITAGIWYTSRLVNDSGHSPNRLYNPQQSANTVVYAYFGSWPPNRKLLLGAAAATSTTIITLLGYPGNLQFVQSPKGLVVDLSGVQWLKLVNKWAWILKLSNLKQSGRVPDIVNAAVQLGQSSKSIVTELFHEFTQ